MAKTSKAGGVHSHGCQTPSKMRLSLCLAVICSPTKTWTLTLLRSEKFTSRSAISKPSAASFPSESRGAHAPPPWFQSRRCSGGRMKLYVLCFVCFALSRTISDAALRPPIQYFTRQLPHLPAPIVYVRRTSFPQPARCY